MKSPSVKARGQSRPAISLRVPIPSAEKLTLVRCSFTAAAGLPVRENNQLRSEASDNATNYACQQPAAGLTSCRFSA
jgi:hypothetical protein